MNLIKGVWASRRNHLITIEYLQEKLGNRRFRMNIGWAISLTAKLLRLIRKEVCSDLMVEYSKLVDECNLLLIYECKKTLQKNEKLKKNKRKKK